MQRRIDLMDKSYMVTTLGQKGSQMIQVDDTLPKTASIKKINDFLHTIDMGGEETRVYIAVKGDTVFVKAFDRTFTLRIVDPVEQASQTTGGGGDNALAPMPGTVVEVHVGKGDRVARGQELMTIESMKILTIINASRDGRVDGVNFEPGMTFDKNDILVSLESKEEA